MSLPAQPNQSLIDGLAALQDLAGRGRPMGGRELARELGLEPTRVNRLLKTLAHLGMLEQTPDRKYHPGPGIHVLAAQSLFGSGLLRRALPHLESLHRHGCIVALGVLWRDQVSYLYHAAPGMPAAEALGRVSVFPATRSGIGMALLADRPVRNIRHLYRGRPIPGQRGVAALLMQLAEIRRAGHALVPITDAPVRSGDPPRPPTGRASHPPTDPLRPPTAILAVPVGNPATAAIALSGELSSANLAPLIESLTTAAAAIAAPTV